MYIQCSTFGDVNQFLGLTFDESDRDLPAGRLFWFINLMPHHYHCDLQALYASIIASYCNNRNPFLFKSASDLNYLIIMGRYTRCFPITALVAVAGNIILAYLLFTNKSYLYRQRAGFNGTGHRLFR